MHGADAADALDRHARAGGDARFCITGQGFALRAEPFPPAMMSPAVDRDDLRHGLLLLLPLLLNIHLQYPSPALPVVAYRTIIIF